MIIMAQSENDGGMCHAESILSEAQDPVCDGVSAPEF
jgi:hypothetical protein